MSTVNATDVLNGEDKPTIEAIVSDMAGIANDDIVEIDSSTVATGEYAKFTANGLESKSFSEVKTDLELVVGTDVQAYDATIVVDGDFTSNGVLNRTGAGAYSILSIGTDIQAYDVDTAKTDTIQTFTVSQRGTITTDNDGSLSLASTNHFKITPAAAMQLTFTDLAAGQSGNIILDNSGGETITKGAMVKAGSTFLTDVTVAGIYWLSYHSDGTNVYVSYSEALS